ncbi:MAG TPA: hypothetical protein VFA27_08020 [Vicinamibacterales bacterium]|nr:hypothetical protein [Vicinamibacterales bacterium]
MRIGMLGSGMMGGKLGTLLARVGHDLAFSYARSREAGSARATGRGAGRHAGRTRRPSLACCGDDGRAKRWSRRLIRDVSFEPEEVGPLRRARYLEPVALLMASMA